MVRSISAVPNALPQVMDPETRGRWKLYLNFPDAVPEAASVGERV